MRTLGYHRFVAVVLATFLGWTLAGGGQIAGFGGPALSPAGQQGRTSGTAVQPQATRVPPQQTPPVQTSPDVAAPGNPVVVVSKSFGDITLELFTDRAPVSVQNFLQYVNEGFYTDTVFHRVKKGFMIQGGGYTATLFEKPTRPPILNEATNGLHNARGTVGMARRPALRSATSQFYINVVDNRILDHTGYAPSDFGYAVFGRVLSGMDVADRIVAVPTTTKDDMEDVPVEPVIIKSVRVTK
jgi:cyclophilin family peptidyl-prolyl cis-trans isomerase